MTAIQPCPGAPTAWVTRLCCGATVGPQCVGVPDGVWLAENYSTCMDPELQALDIATQNISYITSTLLTILDNRSHTLGVLDVARAAGLLEYALAVPTDSAVHAAVAACLSVLAFIMPSTLQASLAQQLMLSNVTEYMTLEATARAGGLARLAEIAVDTAMHAGSVFVVRRPKAVLAVTAVDPSVPVVWNSSAVAVTQSEGSLYLPAAACAALCGAYPCEVAAALYDDASMFVAKQLALTVAGVAASGVMSFRIAARDNSTNVSFAPVPLAVPLVAPVNMTFTLGCAAGCQAALAASLGLATGLRVDAASIALTVDATGVHAVFTPIGSAAATARRSASSVQRVELQSSCAWWNFAVGWDASGCDTALDAETGRVVCTCMHLTNFAVLVTPRNGAQASQTGLAQSLLSLISIIGCSISLVSMAALICTVLWLRNRKFITVNYWLLVNLCVALMG